MSGAYTLLELDGLQECRMVRRVNRFVVEAVDAGEQLVSVHSRNTGRLEDVLTQGARLLCLPRRGARTSHRLVAAWYHGGWAVVDTGLQEDALAIAFDRGLVEGFTGCRLLRRRPRLGGSVLDFLLECPRGLTYVESKSAVLASRDGYALYPDCPTERGRRHIRELIAATERGLHTAVVFVAAFPGARGFRPNERADPVVASLLRVAVQRGVEVRAVGLELAKKGRKWAAVLYSRGLPVELG